MGSDGDTTPPLRVIHASRFSTFAGFVWATTMLCVCVIAIRIGDPGRINAYGLIAATCLLLWPVTVQGAKLIRPPVLTIRNATVALQRPGSTRVWRFDKCGNFAVIAEHRAPFLSIPISFDYADPPASKAWRLWQRVTKRSRARMKMGNTGIAGSFIGISADGLASVLNQRVLLTSGPTERLSSHTLPTPAQR